MGDLKLHAVLSKKGKLRLRYKEGSELEFTPIDAHFTSLGSVPANTRIIEVQMDTRDLMTDARRVRITIETSLEIEA